MIKLLIIILFLNLVNSLNHPSIQRFLKTHKDVNPELIGFNMENGIIYPSIDEFWTKMNIEKFNLSGKKFYEKVGKSDNSVQSDFPGFSRIVNPLEADFNTRFLKKLNLQHHLRFDNALDAAAGNGRSTRIFLSKIYKNVDLNERDTYLLESAKKSLQGNPHVRNFYHSSLQDFEFKHKYDLIWVEEVLMFMSDQDCIKYLKKAKNALSQGGVIIVNAYINKRKGFVFFQQNALYRSLYLFKRLFKKADLTLLKYGQQRPYPKIPWGKLNFVLQ